jgi:hypothetical protein
VRDDLACRQLPESISGVSESVSGVYDTRYTQVTRITNVGTQDGSLDFLS